MRRMLGLVLVLLMLPALQWGRLADEVLITLGGDCVLGTAGRVEGRMRQILRYHDCAEGLRMVL